MGVAFSPAELPVSADRADVLRELVKARAGLREIAVRLDAPGVGGTAGAAPPGGP